MVELSATHPELKSTGNPDEDAPGCSHYATTPKNAAAPSRVDALATSYSLACSSYRSSLQSADLKSWDRIAEDRHSTVSASCPSSTK